MPIISMIQYYSLLPAQQTA